MVDIPTIPFAAGVILLSLAIYRYIIHPAFLSPLAKVPNAHWSVPYTRLWIFHHRYHEIETPAAHQAHQRLGPIVRIAPNDLSINSVDGGIRTIYAGGYGKGDWYKNIFNNYGIMPMFAMPDHGPHSKRKRMLSNIYAKSTLQNSESVRAISKIFLDERLIPRLREMVRSGQPVEFYDVFAAVTMDFVSAYIFGLGNSSQMIERPDMEKKFFRDYKARQRFQFWNQDLPQLTDFLSRIGLKWLIIPEWVDQANADIEALVLNMCDGAEKTLQRIEADGVQQKPQNYPTVYAQLRNALLKDTATKPDLDLPIPELIRQQRLEVASELLDHTLAGFDTSSITLTFFAWELSRPCNKIWHDALRQELSSVKDIHDAKAIDARPILHATLMETLRLHAAIPGNQPRITPQAAELGIKNDARGTLHLPNLPAGIRVQSQAWSLHRNPSVFPDPESWNPGRYLSPASHLSPYPSQADFDAAMKEMSKWFWAFGSGGRMCVGSNLAMLDMKAIIAAIWTAFATEEVDGRGMVHRGGYVAEPVGVEGKFCLLRLQERRPGL
ncbi:putative P450 monooxygenase [Teratosphaeria nubilosa]|uniref:Putative P450 monooxygenase n=1 Tax=Teratosphaeria nubilosa TaxID=161662 RepID=A0A6G1LDF9_9PEZI|nr:putative P450 monooxygenase [Teratosphaeria nubilosa]